MVRLWRRRRPRAGLGAAVLSKGSTRSALALVAVLVCVAAGLYVRTRHGLEWEAESIRQLVEGYGFWGPLVFTLLVAFRLVFLIPSQVMLVAAGVCFGFIEGTLYGTLGIALSGLIAFWLVRALGGKRLAARVPPRLQGLFDRGGRRGGAMLVILGTSYPVGPMTAFHAGAGLTTMGYGLFLGAVSLGALMRSLLFSFLGARLIEAGLLSSWPALLALGIVLLPILHGPTRRQLTAWFAASGEPPKHG